MAQAGSGASPAGPTGSMPSSWEQVQQSEQTVNPPADEREPRRRRRLGTARDMKTEKIVGSLDGMATIVTVGISQLLQRPIPGWLMIHGGQHGGRELLDHRRCFRLHPHRDRGP